MLKLPFSQQPDSQYLSPHHFQIRRDSFRETVGAVEEFVHCRAGYKILPEITGDCCEFLCVYFYRAKYTKIHIVLHNNTLEATTTPEFTVEMNCLRGDRVAFHQFYNDCMNQLIPLNPAMTTTPWSPFTPPCVPVDRKIIIENIQTWIRNANLNQPLYVQLLCDIVFKHRYHAVLIENNICELLWSYSLRLENKTTDIETPQYALLALEHLSNNKYNSFVIDGFRKVGPNDGTIENLILLLVNNIWGNWDVANNMELYELYEYRRASAQILLNISVSHNRDLMICLSKLPDRRQILPTVIGRLWNELFSRVCIDGNGC